MEERKAPTTDEGWRSRLGSVIDAAAYAVSPKWGAQRMATRRLWQRAAQHASRIEDSRRDPVMAAYSGADTERLRGDRWLASRLSADSSLETDLETLRHRSRETYRDDSVGGAVDSKVANVVGCGFMVQGRVVPFPGVVSDSQAKAINGQLEGVYWRIQDSIDKTRRMSVWQVSRLVERCYLVDGEALIVFSDIGDSERPVPLACEVVDVDRLETPPKHLANPRVRMGIEHGANGRIVAYHIRESHPGDTIQVDYEYRRVPASRVCHVFDPWFAGQSRGLPWMTRVLNRIRDAKDLDEAAIIAAQVEACFAVFVTKGGNDGAFAAAYAAGNGTTVAPARREQDIHPGTIKYLEDGDTVSTGNPNRPGGNFAPFQEWNYRRVAAGMNHPFEMLVKNWSGLSFATGRISLQDGRIAFKCDQKLLNERFLTPLWRRMVEEAVIVGEVSIDAREYARRRWVFDAHEWIPPKFEYSVNPLDDINADILEIDHDLATQASKVAARGEDWQEVADQRDLERARLGTEPEGETAGDRSRRGTETNREPSTAMSAAHREAVLEAAAR